MSAAVDVRPVSARSDLERFLRLPWQIYAGDPHWVPPLLADVRAALNRGSHPFHAHAEVESFLAVREGRVVGRITAVVNRAHNEFHEDSLGFFGLFESIDDQQVADALLGAAQQWLAERGMTAMRGPMNLSTNEEVCSPGVLVEGFHRPPAIMMAHTPPYYQDLLVGGGCEKSMDLLAFWMDTPEPPARLRRAYDRLLRDERIRVRPIDLRKFEEEVATIQSVYNSAWERNWGFVPMTAAEIEHMASQLKPVVNPRLCAIAEFDGEPVAFALGLPDYNRALKHMNGRLFPFGVLKLLWYRRGIDTARTITLGVKPGFRGRGLDGLLTAHLILEANSIGIWRTECSWILEDNWDMRRGIERSGGIADKTYRVFDKQFR